MVWLARTEIANKSEIENMPRVRPHYPFDPNREYWWLDLDGSDAVQGLANFYGDAGDAGFFGTKIVEQLELQRAKDLGSIAIYIEYDNRNYWPESAFAFIAADSDFQPELP